MQDINFFDHYQQQELASKKKTPVLLGSALLVTMLALTGAMTYQTWQLNQTIASYETQLQNPTLQAKVIEVQKIEEELTLLTELENQVIEVTTAINQRDANISQTLVAISQIMPKTVTLDQTTMTSQTMTMTAQATTRQAIAEFQHNLKELNIFTDVYVSTIQPASGENKNFNFQVQCQLGGKTYETE
ncbi:MAG: PilN domain-containing protein [Culicoidibacterales bacterium]